MSVEAPPAPPPPAAPPVTPPVVNTSPFHSDWLKADGTLNAESYKRLPEDIRYIGENLSKYKTPEELIRGIAHQQTLAGKKGLIPLADNAPAEARAERKALLDSINGVPALAKEYGLTRPESIPEGAWDTGYIEKVQAWAHENSISPGVMKKLVSDIVTPQMQAQMAQAQTDQAAFWAGQRAEFDAAIKKEGVPADKANALAERAATSLGFDLTNESHKLILQNATVRMAMMRHAVATGEDAYVAGEAGKGEGGDALALANDAVHNKANPLNAPLMDAKHPQHAMAKQKVDAWFRAAAAKK